MKSAREGAQSETLAIAGSVVAVSEISDAQRPLPIDGLPVIAVEFWPAWVTLVIGLAAPHLCKLQISSKCTLRLHDTNSELPPPDRSTGEDLAPLLDLRQAIVARAYATSAGNATLEFDDGRVLGVQPDPVYEAWEFSGPGMHLVCAPDGNISGW
jgi:hypothetical protein